MGRFKVRIETIEHLERFKTEMIVVPLGIGLLLPWINVSNPYKEVNQIKHDVLVGKEVGQYNYNH